MKKITTSLLLLFAMVTTLYGQKASYCDSIVAEVNVSISGTKVSFTTKTSATVIYQEWSFGDGTGSKDLDVTHDYGRAGTYTPCVYLKFKNLRDPNNPCVKKICKTVTIKDKDSCAGFNPSFSYKIDTGGVVYFEASGSNTSTSYTYKWDFGDNTDGKNKGEKHTYKPGSYKVCVTVTDPTTKCTKTVCQEITITQKDPCKGFNPGADIKYDTTGLAYFEADTGKDLNYRWDFGDGTDSDDRTGKHQYKSGTYKACVTIYNSKTKCTVTLCKTITIGNTDPCAGFNPKFEFKIGSNGEVSFWGAGNGGTNYYYSWSYGDGTSGTGIQTTHTYKPGTYKMCVTIKDLTTKCYKTLCETITISGTDPCKDFNPSFGYKVDGTTVIFEADYNANFTYSWTFSNNSSNNDRIVKIDFKKPGTYKACVTIYDKKTGCKKTICKEIVIKGKQQNNDPCKNFNPKVSFQLEDKGKVNFEADGGKGATFSWDFGDGSKGSKDRSPSHTYSKSGKYTICVTVYDAKRQCKKTICFTIEVTVKSSNPCDDFKPDFSFSVNGSKVTVEGNIKGIDYSWSWGDKQTGSGRVADHSYKTTGKYTICMTAYDSKTGCKKTICKTITTGKQRLVSPDDDNDDDALIIYPNPADQRLSVVTTSTSEARITVKDANGNEVLRYDATPSESKTIDLIIESLPKGNYYINVDQDGKIETTKFMK